MFNIIGSSSSSDDGSSEFVQLDKDRRHSWSSGDTFGKESIGKLLNFSDSGSSVDLSFDPFEGCGDLVLKKMATNSPSRNSTFGRRAQSKSVRFSDVELQSFQQIAGKSTEIQLQSAESLRMKVKDNGTDSVNSSPDRIASSNYSDMAAVNVDSIFKKSYSKIYSLHENSIQRKFSCSSNDNPYLEDADGNYDASLNEDEFENMLLGNDDLDEFTSKLREKKEKEYNINSTTKDSTKNGEPSSPTPLSSNQVCSTFTKASSNNFCCEGDITESNLDVDDSNIVEDLVPKLREFKLAIPKRDKQNGNENFPSSSSSVMKNAKNNILENMSPPSNKFNIQPIGNSSPISQSPFLEQNEPTVKTVKEEKGTMSKASGKLDLVCLSSSISSNAYIDEGIVSQLKEMILMLQSMSPLENSVPLTEQDTMSDAMAVLLNLSKKASTKFYHVQSEYHTLSNNLMDKETALAKSYERRANLEKEIDQLKEKLKESNKENKKLHNKWAATSIEFENNMNKVDMLAVQVNTVESNLKNTKSKLDNKFKIIEEMKEVIREYYPNEEIESDYELIVILGEKLAFTGHLKRLNETNIECKEGLEKEILKYERFFKESKTEVDNTVNIATLKFKNLEETIEALQKESTKEKNDWRNYEIELASKIEEAVRQRREAEEKLEKEMLHFFEKTENFYKMEEENIHLKESLNECINGIEELESHLTKEAGNQNKLKERIKEKEIEIATYKEKILKLNNSIKSHSGDMTSKTEEIKKLSDVVDKYKTDTAIQINETKELQVKLKASDEKNIGQIEEIRRFGGIIQEREEIMNGKMKELTEFKETIANNEIEMGKQMEKITHLSNDIKMSEDQMGKNIREIAELKEKNRTNGINNDLRIDELSNTNRELCKKINDIQSENSHLKVSIAQNKTVEEKTLILAKENEELKMVIQRSNSEIKELNTANHNFILTKEVYVKLIYEIFQVICVYLEEESTSEFKRNFNLISANQISGQDTEIMINLNKFLSEGIKIIIKEILVINKNNANYKNLICTQQNEIDKLINKLEYSEDKIKKIKTFKSY